MEDRPSDQLPLVVIVGSTASGKTALAIKVAQSFNGEIICADSRTVYKNMDIGTAKPTIAEQGDVPHWGLDLVEPGERFTAADFKVYASQKIQEIRDRGHLPLLVGGTGLYIDAILFDYQFGSGYSPSFRTTLERQSLDWLQNYCINNNIELPENKFNKRYVIRAIEQKSINTNRKDTIIENTIVVGISTHKAMLRRRITDRTEQLFAQGVVKEAIMLGEKYGWKSEAMTGNIYRLVRMYLLNMATLEEIKIKNTTLDWRLAKKQLTWFKRNPYIKWLPVDNVSKYISEQLANR